jgi:hypothetical protein
MTGDGAAHFTALPGQTSGIKVYGEQRGCAAADYDQDGRVDLVVTQNGGLTKLFHNLSATPGLRVRLAGPPGNPDAIGAAVRLESDTGKGPTHEIHAGSGYWSQDGAVQLLSCAGKPLRVWVRWPGGKQTRTAVPVGARSILIAPDGSAKD